MGKIGFTIAPGPHDGLAEANVALPVVWGNVHETRETGVYLDTKGSDGNAIAAVNGHVYLRPGTVLIKTSGNIWRAVNQGAAATSPDTDKNKAIFEADAVGILKATVDLVDGGGMVGIYISGGFFGARMPSIAANGTPGLEATALTALKLRGFKFAEDY